MNLEDLKTQWAAYDQKLERSIRLNLRLLRDAGVQKTNAALQRLGRAVFGELLIDFVAVAGLGLFIGQHKSDLSFLLPALLLDVVAICHLAFGVYQLVTLKQLDFSAPILVSQKQLAILRLHRIRVTQWTLLLCPLLWVPLLIVGLKAVGVNAYTTLNLGWLIANVIFGVVMIPVLLGVSKWAANRWRGARWIQAFLDDLAGSDLMAAQTFLREIADFEREAEAA